MEWTHLFDHGWRDLILNCCCALTAFGGYPDPPAVFIRAIERAPILKWALMVALIYQGGGEQDIGLAIELSILIYLVLRMLKQMEEKNEGEVDEK